MKKQVVLVAPVVVALSLLLIVWQWVLAAPSLTNNGININEGSVDNVISNSELSVDDPDNLTAEFTYTVDTAPQHGTLFLGENPLSDGSGFTQTEIDTGLLTYDHDGTENFSDNFIFTVISSTGVISSSQSFDITITPQNDAPTAVDDAIELEEGATATSLVGGDTSVRANDTDADNNLTELTVNTSPITGPSHAAVFTLNSDGTFSYQHDGSENLSDSFTYQVCDPEPACDTAVVNITVNGIIDTEPVIGDDTFSINENPDGDAVVRTINATDPEVDNGYDTLSFSIESGNTGNAFSLVKTGNITAELRVNTSSAIDHETNPTFTIGIQVTDDGSNTDTATLNITVNDVNESPSINNDTFNVPEGAGNGDVVGNVDASDPEGDSLTYTITNSPCDNVFTIDNSGQITVADNSQLDHETTPSYSCTVEVKDTADNPDTATITINVTDVNEAPTINDQTFTLDENAPDGSNVNTVAASDPDADDADNLTFAIINQVPEAAFDINNSSGLIEVSNSSQLDFETNPTFTVTVRVTDSGGPGGATLSDEADITISLTDVNEAPTIPGGQTLSVPENSGNGTAVTPTVTASDQDAGDTLTFDVTNAPCNNIFDIDNGGTITVIDGSQLDHEATPSYNCTVEVTDGSLSASATVTINVTDVNEKPSVTAGQTFSVVGFADNGTVVGTVAASDPDDGDTLSYAITGGNDGNAFRINANNGRLIVKNSDALDFETRPTFNLSIRVSDSGSLNDTKTITVNLTEPPVYLVMLPLAANNYRPPDEPNNACGEAHSIAPNFTYNYFLPNDATDWYVFQLTNPANLTVTLSNFTPIQGQIILYRGTCGSLTFIRNNGNFQSTKIISVGVQPAGTYYVRIIIDGPKSTTPYNLRIDAP